MHTRDEHRFFIVVGMWLNHFDLDLLGEIVGFLPGHDIAVLSALPPSRLREAIRLEYHRRERNANSIKSKLQTTVSVWKKRASHGIKDALTIRAIEEMGLEFRKSAESMSKSSMAPFTVWCGKLRTTEVRIVGSPHRPPPAPKVRDLLKGYVNIMEKAVANVKKEGKSSQVPLFVFQLIGCAYWKFVHTHPFEDANGRVANLIAFTVLRKYVSSFPDPKVEKSNVSSGGIGKLGQTFESVDTIESAVRSFALLGDENDNDDYKSSIKGKPIDRETIEFLYEKGTENGRAAAGRIVGGLIGILKATKSHGVRPFMDFSRAERKKDLVHCLHVLDSLWRRYAKDDKVELVNYLKASGRASVENTCGIYRALGRLGLLLVFGVWNIPPSRCEPAVRCYRWRNEMGGGDYSTGITYLTPEAAARDDQITGETVVQGRPNPRHAKDYKVDEEKLDLSPPGSCPDLMF